MWSGGGMGDQVEEFSPVKYTGFRSAPAGPFLAVRSILPQEVLQA